MIKDINALTPEYLKYRIEQETEQYKQEIERLKEELEKLNGELRRYKSIVYLCEKVKDCDKE